MTDLAWMKVYIGTETALTAHLTAEEFGAYERLRRHYWQHGSMPSDDARLMRISGIDPDRWEGVAQAIGPLMSEGLQRLDGERSDARIKREKKVAAGHRGAEARWRINGKANAIANGTTMADASEEMAEPSVCHWPSASASASDKIAPDEKEEGLALTREREPNIMLMSMAESKAFLEAKEAREANAYLAAKGA
ncbi:MAG: DUF1376 domain-containing protein [Mesorhizobium sp.]|nr:MAG: DUF1376 domain-containing protein [Mesorhizobium sp.]